MSGVELTPVTAAGTEETRRRRLRRMKAGATGLLVLALGTFVVTYAIGGSSQWLLFVRAGSEAAMVGGLADWFAVTALFRHPLGLPIPHTALIPTRKDDLAVTLAEYVETEFLVPTALNSFVVSANLVGRLGAWACEPANAEQVREQTSTVVKWFARTTGADPIVNAILQTVEVDVGRRSYAAQAGEFIDIVLSEHSHAAALDLLLDQAASALRRDDDELVDWVKQRIESMGPLHWLLIWDSAVRRLVRSTADQLDAIRGDAVHPLRLSLDTLLQGVANDLRADTQIAREIDKACRDFVSHPRLRQWLREVVTAGLDALEIALADPESESSHWLTREVREWGERITSDDELRRTFDSFVEEVVVPVACENRQIVSNLIVQTMATKSAEEASAQIETFVGRDLQFVRVNGTVVGALAGVAIHAVSLLL